MSETREEGHTSTKHSTNMNKENCTKGPVTAKPFLTPREDEDPMMVYKVEGGDLQARFDALTVDENGDYDQDQVDALHAENEANAELIAEAFNVLHETGMTPRELVKALRRLYDATSCIDGMLDGDRDKQEAWEDEVSELDRARAEANLILSHQPVTPA